MITIRPESPEDCAAIFAVHRDAFPSDAEARLVDRLRDHAAPFVSLVARAEREIIGHVLLTPVVVRSASCASGASAAGTEWRAFGLAPLSVTPAQQRSGIGGRLVRAAFDAARDEVARQLVPEIAPVIVVLGHPAYYPRLGFRPAASLGLHYSHPGHEAAFFVSELATGALAGRGGVVHFDPAFDAL